ncbi:MAG: nitroreductase family protein [Candidatus Pacebacteria bacterium]|nr:nitroreductase family protein [Candidatus Paceibacterota bacterium]
MLFNPPTNIKKYRQPNYSINPLIYSRFSPRAMSGELISHEQLLSLFEAARWAPSASNLQPWKFFYAHKETKYWATYFSFLSEFNQIWTKNAAVLVVVTAQIVNEKGVSKTAEFDAGAAWQNLALEATNQGLIAHGIGGFDREKAAEELNLPDSYKTIAMIAIGKPGDLNQIPERMHKQEIPNQRKELAEIVQEGKLD